MLPFIRTLCNGLLDLALPPRCHVCRQTMTGTDPLHICPGCLEALPFITSPLCTVCGIPFNGAGEDHPCGDCLTDPPPFHAARAALRYDTACRDLIHAFKYDGRSHLRRPLGLLAARSLAPFAAGFGADLLVPVPLHTTRLRSRGFNQAVLLAEILSHEWQTPLNRQAMVRTRRTTPQMELDRNQRLHNLHGAFNVTDLRAVAGKRIMVVDDVFTTGSTLAECAKVLKSAGATDVAAVTVAHAP